MQIFRAVIRDLKFLNFNLIVLKIARIISAIVQCDFQNNKGKLLHHLLDKTYSYQYFLGKEPINGYLLSISFPGPLFPRDKDSGNEVSLFSGPK